MICHHKSNETENQFFSFEYTVDSRLTHRVTNKNNSQLKIDTHLRNRRVPAGHVEPKTKSTKEEEGEKETIKYHKNARMFYR